MTNKYYTEMLVSMYLKVIQNASSAERRAILQKNNDSSHETKDTDDNLTRRFEQKHAIGRLRHSAQSPDLNSAETV